MRAWKTVALLAPLGVMLMVAPGLAHPRGGGACRDDIQKLCPGLKPGGGSIRDCLKEHAAELSPACQEQVSKIKAKMEQWRQACQADVQKFCGDVTPGHGGVGKCLHQHRDELSQSCQDQLAQFRRHRHHRHHGPAPTPGTESSAQ